MADEVVVVGDFYQAFFEASPEVVVEFAAEVEEVLGVGGLVADVDAFDPGVVEFVESVEDACADAYFVDSDGLWVVFVDGVDDESGGPHGVEFLVLVEGDDVVALADADDCAVGAEACDVDADVDGGCEVACVWRLAPGVGGLLAR